MHWGGASRLERRTYASPLGATFLTVIPAHAGIQGFCLFVFVLRFFPSEWCEHETPVHVDPHRLWIPAFAGMTAERFDSTRKGFFNRPDERGFETTAKGSITPSVGIGRDLSLRALLPGWFYSRNHETRLFQQPRSRATRADFMICSFKINGRIKIRLPLHGRVISQIWSGREATACIDTGGRPPGRIS